MKKLFFCVSLLIAFKAGYSQSVDGNVTIDQLAVPNSPAFILLDAAPSNVVTPNTPKEFALGAIQNFDYTSKWFQNYSMEFTPYWWIRPSKRDVYSFIGIDNATVKNKPFAGLQFTSISAAFLNKKIIPDTTQNTQKIVSVGVRIPVLKIRQKDFAGRINTKINAWHTQAQAELTIWQNEIFNETDTLKQRELIKKYANAKSQSTAKIAENIQELINEKPAFSIDLAAAHSQYGINDTVWKAGRSGAWITMGTYIPVFNKQQQPYDNYLKGLVSFRYLNDNYVKMDDGSIGVSTSMDIGFNVGFEIDNLSIAAEGFFRKTNGVDKMQQRLVGVINYKIAKNLFISGTYGDDFGPANKLVALFGLNWGFGTESVVLP